MDEEAEGVRKTLFFEFKFTDNNPQKTPYYTPAQNPPSGTALSKDPPKLFTPLRLRGIELQNRIMLSPLCQYSAKNGHLTDW